MSRFKAIPWLLGVALLAIALVAALRLPAPDSSAGGGGGGGTQAVSGAPMSGMTIVGTVDAPGGVQAVHPPGVLGVAALRIKKVLVKEGDSVKAGDVLIEFDSSQVTEKVAAAKAAANAADWLVAQAALGRKTLEVLREEQKLGERKAKEDLDAATRVRDIVKNKLEDLITKKGGLTEAEKARWRTEDADMIQAEETVRRAKLAVDAAAVKGRSLEPNPVESGENAKPTAVRAQEAEENAAKAKLAAARAQQADAEAAAAAYTLKAEAGGVVEQLTASEGANVGVGPGARVPLMYLVPAGPRVVRAEVEAEFAGKLLGFEGKPVTVCDAHQFNHTYPGRAGRMGTAYLPKRFGGDSFAVAPARVVEFVIEVPDPAPHGKPPLRPGQPVRVVFGP